jgi:ribonuclease G
MAAATEIARQLRLRDIGGIIIIDFIDMDERANQQKLHEHMVQQMEPDRARHNVLPLSRFCLMQITRQRVRPAMAVNTQETCPTCFGSGKAQPSILFTDQLEATINTIVHAMGIKKFVLHVHPYVAAYINKGFWSQKRRWQSAYSWGLRIVPIQAMGFLQYKFCNRAGEEINTHLLDDEKITGIEDTA